jgi:hypothetical protein
MPISITYLAVALLAYLGIDNATEVVDALMVLVFASIALWGRYRAGGLTILGTRK